MHPFAETATVGQATVQPAWGPSATWWLLWECPGVLAGLGGRGAEYLGVAADPAPEAPTPPGRSPASRTLLEVAGRCRPLGVASLAPIHPGAQEGCGSSTRSPRAELKPASVIPAAVVRAPRACWHHVGVSVESPSWFLCVCSMCWCPGWAPSVWPHSGTPELGGRAWQRGRSRHPQRGGGSSGPRGDAAVTAHSGQRQGSAP